jgi:hypothetical protein
MVFFVTLLQNLCMKIPGILFTTLVLFAFADNMKPNTKFSEEVFPNKVGDHWAYKFNGYGTSENNSNDSISIDVIGQLFLPDGQKAGIWLFSFPNGTDTNYVESKKDTIIFFNKYSNYCDSCAGMMPVEKVRYVFPLHTNNAWVSNYDFADTIKVLSVSTLSVPYGDLPNTYQLTNMPNRSHFIGNFRRTDTIWITPHIGISKIVQREYQMAPVIGNGEWELLNCYLK